MLLDRILGKCRQEYGMAFKIYRYEESHETCKSAAMGNDVGPSILWQPKLPCHSPQLKSKRRIYVPYYKWGLPPPLPILRITKRHVNIYLASCGGFCPPQIFVFKYFITQGYSATSSCTGLHSHFIIIITVVLNATLFPVVFKFVGSSSLQKTQMTTQEVV